jgi:diacylglycerol kinase (ATP)
MRVALIHNRKAGEGIYDEQDLERLFLDAGHEVACFGKKRKEIDRATAGDFDVYAVAGGDGSVAKAAFSIHEHGSTRPLFIMPTGTANNIARSLRVDGTTPTLVKALASARAVRMDVGMLTAPWGNRPFIEAAGLGFFGTMLHQEHSLRTRVERMIRNVRPASDDPFEMSARGIARLVRRQRARHHTVRADGEDLSGEYIAIEAMNITSIGPRMALAPQADSSDGMLDLLLVPEADRDALADYIESAGKAGELRESWYRRVRSAELSWAPKIGHVDDAPWPDDDDDTLDMSGIVTAAITGTIEVLLPTQLSRAGRG